MKKVLYWHPDLGIGGTQLSLELCCKGISKRGFKCAISYYSDGDKIRYNNYLGYPEIEHYPISRKNNVQDFNQVLKTFNPDIINVYRSGFPEFPEPGKDFAIGNRRFVEVNVFGHIDNNPNIHKTLFMSEYLMRHIGRVQVVKRFDYLNNPVFHPNSFEDKYDLKKLCGKDTIVLSRLGRDDPGIYDPINVDAVNLLCQRRPELRRKILFYVMSPSNNMIEDLRKYGISYLVAPKTVDEKLITKFINTCDINAYSRADGETCGSSLELYCIHRKPIIVHVSRPKDPLTFPFQAQCSLVENGKTGFVVDHDPLQYSEALETLIDNPELRQKMGQAGYEKAMKEFEVNVCVDKLERIYKELLNEQN